jgi:hypothetical protein
VCSDGYTFSQTSAKCVPCTSDEKSLFSFFNVIVLIFVLLILVITTHCVYIFRVNKTIRDKDDYQLYLLVKIGVCSLDDFERNRDVLRINLINWRSRLEQISLTYVVLFQATSLKFLILYSLNIYFV